MNKAASALKQFAEITDRLPTVDEVLTLCDDCGIGVVLNDEGQPSLRVPTDELRPVAFVLRDIVSSEPFRSQIIERRLKEKS